MANLSVIAKPYAKAAYEFAKEHQAVNQWSELLTILKSLLSDSNMSRLISSPSHSQLDIVDVIKDAILKSFDSGALNFLLLVAEKDKLLLLPFISDLFEEIKNTESGCKKAVVTLASSVDDKLLSELKNKLVAKFNCTIDMNVEINPEIIGGAIVRVGDTVIDDSVQGRLNKMKEVLLS